ncbi:MAG: alkaline phosphatase [Clostridia bacterium]|nr:alkaline phosphatase [Clostridia bacterium]
MKKIICILTAALLTLCMIMPAFAAETAKTQGGYKHVFIIGIDGAGRFIGETDTPNFDRIFKDGAVNYKAKAEVKTDSAPNWGAILTGVSIFRTGLQNGVTDDNERKSDTEFPTVFTYLRKAMPNAELASYVNWNNINKGIIETDVGVTKVNIGDDERLTDAICEYFDAGNSPALFFVQFDSVDHEGHSYGSKAEEYFNQIKTVDGYLGRVYDSIERNGLIDDSLFIVVADHGHMITGGHGGMTQRETQVTLAVRGKTVVKGGKMEEKTRNRDIAAMTLYALGVERPENMTAVIPADLFTDVSGESRPFFTDILDSIISPIAWMINDITEIFGM